MDPNLMWPSMQDLNTRLRRVITSYQRNYKKEELKQQQKAKVSERLHSVHESRVFEVILSVIITLTTHKTLNWLYDISFSVKLK